MISERGREWMEVSKEVLDHIENYTIPQYGDKGQDRFTKMNSDRVMQDAEKHFTRHGKNQRGFVEQKRDFLKIIHEVAVAYCKFCEETEYGG